jgi:hypothetical protein
MRRRGGRCSSIPHASRGGAAAPRPVLVGDLDAQRVAAPIQPRLDPQARAGPGRPDQLDDHLMGDQRPPPPVGRDVAEQPVLDLVPLGGAGREVAHRHRKARLGREPRQLGLPQPDPIPVGPTRVRADQRPLSLGVHCLALLLPPAAQGRHRERGGVMIGPHADPAGVGPQVVDPVGDRLAQLLVGEVVHQHPLGLARRPPLGATIGKAADQLLLLGVHADDQQASGQVLLGLLVDVAKLRVSVRCWAPSSVLRVRCSV